MQTATSEIRTDIAVKCPAPGEVVGRVAVTSTAELETVAARVRPAQPAWQAMGFKERAKVLGAGATGCLTTPTSCPPWCNSRAGNPGVIRPARCYWEHRSS